jgi:hypothetical protein
LNFIENSRTSIKNVGAMMFRFAELKEAKKIDFYTILLVLKGIVNYDTSKNLYGNGEGLCEITSIAFSKSLIETLDAKFIRDVFELLSAIQANCQLYNYEIAQWKLEPVKNQASAVGNPVVHQHFHGPTSGVVGTVEGDQIIHPPPHSIH